LDIIDQTTGKVFDYLELNHHLFRRWAGHKHAPELKRL
jgi:3-polyprenyl-4-hydroxybenzoate decarboxylase